MFYAQQTPDFFNVHWWLYAEKLSLGSGCVRELSAIKTEWKKNRGVCVCVQTVLNQLFLQKTYKLSYLPQYDIKSGTVNFRKIKPVSSGVLQISIQEFI